MTSKRALLYVVSLALVGVLLYLAWPRRAKERPSGEETPSHGRTTATGALPRMPGSALGAGVTVSGTVRDADTAAPVPGVKLTFRSTIDLSTRSADQGRYQLALPAGIYEVELLAEEHVSAWPRPRVQIEEGNATSWLDFTVFRTASVAGRVVDAGRRPLTKARVSVQRARGAVDFEAPVHVASDADGRFTLRVPPGEVVLHADAGAVGSASSRPLYARSGARLAGVEIVVGGGARITGRVIGPGGRVVEEARVLLRDELGLRRLPCDREGKFAEAGLSPTAKQLQAEAKGYAPSQVSLVELQWGVARQVVLQVGPGKGIGGRVVTQDDLPVANARVTVEPGGPAGRLAFLAQVPQKVTDADGNFLFSELPELPLLVTAHGPGNTTAARAGVPPGTYNIVLRLQATGSVVGQVTDGLSGRPIRDFTVSVTEGPPVAPRPTLRVVSATGTFSLAELVPGAYGLAFTARGYGATFKQGVSVVAGYGARVSVALDAGGTIAGIVVDERGAGIPGASVRVDTGWHGASATSDASGKFSIPDVARGRRSLSVAHPEYDTRIEAGVAVLGRETTQVRVALTRRAGAAAGLSLSGIGGVIQRRDKRLAVVKALPGSPAEVAGLRAGDLVLSIDGVSTEQMSFADGIEALRGISGTPVRLRVQRGGEVFEIDVLRGEVAVPGGQ